MRENSFKRLPTSMLHFVCQWSLSEAAGRRWLRTLRLVAQRAAVFVALPFVGSVFAQSVSVSPVPSNVACPRVFSNAGQIGMAPGTWQEIGEQGWQRSAGECIAFRTGAQEEPVTCSQSTGPFTAVFSPHHAVKAERKCWTGAPTDTHRLVLSPIRKIEVSIWIVLWPGASSAGSGILQAIRRNVDADVANLRYLFGSNGCGVDFNVVVENQVTDADFALDCRVLETMPSKLHARVGRVNVYYGALNLNLGEWCVGRPDSVVVDAFRRDSETLAHELGHVFGTPESHHDFAVPDNNVMQSVRVGNAARSSFTPGQCFRFNFDRRSWLMQGVPGSMQCRWGMDNLVCPPIGRK